MPMPVSNINCSCPTACQYMAAYCGTSLIHMSHVFLQHGENAYDVYSMFQATPIAGYSVCYVKIYLLNLNYIPGFWSSSVNVVSVRMNVCNYVVNYLSWEAVHKFATQWTMYATDMPFISLTSDTSTLMTLPGLFTHFALTLYLKMILLLQGSSMISLMRVITENFLSCLVLRCRTLLSFYVRSNMILTLLE